MSRTERLALLGILVLALLTRWHFVETVGVQQPLSGDAGFHALYGYNLATRATFSSSAPDAAVAAPDSFRSPAYPALIAVFMHAHGGSVAWLRSLLTFQALLGAATVALIVALGREFLPTRFALAAGALLAVWPHAISLCAYVLVETLQGFALAAALLCVAIAVRRDSIAMALLGGAALALAALTNPVLGPLALLAPLVALLHKRWRAAALIGLCALAPLGAWSLRNAQLPATATASDRAAVNFVQGSWPEFLAAWRDRSDPALAEVYARANAETAVMLTDRVGGLAQVFDRFREEPRRYILWYGVQKPYLLWDWDIRAGDHDVYVMAVARPLFEIEPAYRALRAIGRAINAPLFVLMLAGLALALRRTTAAGWQLAALAVLLASAIHVVLQAEPRYSTPYRGLEMLLAMAALSTAWSRLARDAERRDAE